MKVDAVTKARNSVALESLLQIQARAKERARPLTRGHSPHVEPLGCATFDARGGVYKDDPAEHEMSRAQGRGWMRMARKNYNAK